MSPALKRCLSDLWRLHDLADLGANRGPAGEAIRAGPRYRWVLLSDAEKDAYAKAADVLRFRRRSLPYSAIGRTDPIQESVPRTGPGVTAAEGIPAGPADFSAPAPVRVNHRANP